jgi:perosamine synthetase
MDPVLEIARKHNLIVIEDCAEAHGAEYKGKRVGVLGDIGCFSFYANKILTTGEGGMLVTNNAAIAERARSLKSLAFGHKNKFMHTAVGYNYRMTNVQAALGVVQLARIETIIEKKRSIAHFYTEAFKDIEALQLPIEKSYAKNVYWMYHIVLRGALSGTRNHVMQKLSENGIETREAFVPYNMQELFIKNGSTERSACPNANIVAENGFYIPSGPVLSDDELSYIATQVRKTVLKI